MRPCLRATCVRCVCAVHAHCARGFGMCVHAAMRTRCSRVHCSCALLCVRIVPVRTRYLRAHYTVRVPCVRAAMRAISARALCMSMCVRCACNVDPDHTGTFVCQHNIFPVNRIRSLQNTPIFVRLLVLMDSTESFDLPERWSSFESVIAILMYPSWGWR